jgi:hypothetical protein
VRAALVSGCGALLVAGCGGADNDSPRPSAQSPTTQSPNAQSSNAQSPGAAAAARTTPAGPAEPAGKSTGATGGSQKPAATLARRTLGPPSQPQR